MEEIVTVACDSKILLSKDAMGKFYLPIYGNSYWSTPNIDALAGKGTVFDCHYTTAPSTAMAMTSMFTGLYPYQTERKYYLPVGESEGYPSLLDKVASQGYECHIVWDSSGKIDKRFTECFGERTVWHWLEGIRQGVGAYRPHEGELVSNEARVDDTVRIIRECLSDIVSSGKRQFVWIHLPHVLNGRTGYGADIDVFDRIVGEARTFFDDDEIYVTSDHGNMNGTRGKYCYGFDVYEPSICIPLVAPKVEGIDRCSFNTSNKDLLEIVFEGRIPRNEFVYSDSAYYAQPHRKLAIIHDEYRYIYNKKNGSEELYDIDVDPSQMRNLIDDFFYDADRNVDTSLAEMYFYPKWGRAKEMRELMRAEKNNIWREATRAEKAHGKAEDSAKALYKKVRQIYRNATKGKEGSALR